VRPLALWQDRRLDPVPAFLHVGDVGHTLIVGPTGAGKSVLLALMALQFRRYPQSQVFAFDFGGSIRAAALAMRGDWHDLGGGLTEGAETRRSSRSPASTTSPSAPGPPTGSSRSSCAKACRHARGEGAYVVGADLAGVRAGRRAHMTGLPSCSSPTT
jgi:hypothetical protein